MTIKEKNALIQEILANLKQEEDIFFPETHELEMPEKIFEVNDDEVQVERVYTKEERAKIEEERKRLEEKER